MDILSQTLAALRELMAMFRLERIIYLICTVVSFCLMVYAVVLFFNQKGVSLEAFGLIFGATGVTAVSAARVTFFLNKSFDLVDAIVRRAADLEPKP